MISDTTPTTPTNSANTNPGVEAARTRQKQRDDMIRQRASLELKKRSKALEPVSLSSHSYSYQKNHSGKPNGNAALSEKFPAGTVGSLLAISSHSHKLANNNNNHIPRDILPSNAKVMDAANLMAAYRKDCVLVSDPVNGDLVGIFTDKDLIFKVVAKAKDPFRVSLEDVMTRDPVSVDAMTPIGDAIKKMSVGKFRHLPVVMEKSETTSSTVILGAIDIISCLGSLLGKLQQHHKTSTQLMQAFETISAENFYGEAMVDNNATSTATSSSTIQSYITKLHAHLSSPTLANALPSDDYIPPVVDTKTNVLEAVRVMNAFRETAVLVFDHTHQPSSTQQSVYSDPLAAKKASQSYRMGQLVGILTTKDVLLRVVANKRDAKQTSVVSVMTFSPKTVALDDKIIDALEQMNAGRYLHLPISSSSTDPIKRIIGLTDLLKLTHIVLRQLDSLESLNNTQPEQQPQEQPSEPLWHSLLLQDQKPDDNSSNATSGAIRDHKRVLSDTSSVLSGSTGSVSGINGPRHGAFSPMSASSFYFSEMEYDSHSAQPMFASTQNTEDPILWGEYMTFVQERQTQVTNPDPVVSSPIPAELEQQQQEEEELVFSFKLKQPPTNLCKGFTHRFISNADLGSLEEHVRSKLVLEFGQDSESEDDEQNQRRLEILGKKIRLAYVDEDMDWCALETNEDLVNAVQAGMQKRWNVILLKMVDLDGDEELEDKEPEVVNVIEQQNEEQRDRQDSAKVLLDKATEWVSTRFGAVNERRESNIIKEWGLGVTMGMGVGMVLIAGGMVVRKLFA